MFRGNRLVLVWLTASLTLTVLTLLAVGAIHKHDRKVEEANNKDIATFIHKRAVADCQSLRDGNAVCTTVSIFSESISCEVALPCWATTVTQKKLSYYSVYKVIYDDGGFRVLKFYPPGSDQ